VARCDLTGVGAHFGRKVSHSNRKSSRTFLPNVQAVTLTSAALGRDLRLRVTTRVLRTVQKHGGLDGYLLGTDDAKLTPQARKLKGRVRRALSGPVRSEAAGA